MPSYVSKLEARIAQQDKLLADLMSSQEASAAEWLALVNQLRHEIKALKALVNDPVLILANEISSYQNADR